jgi:hypothetical protein
LYLAGHRREPRPEGSTGLRRRGARSGGSRRRGAGRLSRTGR